MELFKASDAKMFLFIKKEMFFLHLLLCDLAHFHFRRRKLFSGLLYMIVKNLTHFFFPLHFLVKYFPSDMCLSSSEGGEELQSHSKLLGLLDAVTDALVWAIAKTGLTFRQQYTRLAHLLMLLSHIRHVRYSTMNRVVLVT